MNDLFRFLLLRPAMAAHTDEVKTLQGSFAGANARHANARADAKAFVANHGVMRSREDLAYAGAADAALQILRDGPRPATDVIKAVEAAAGMKIAQIVADAAFARDESRLEDSLVAMKLLSSSLGGDAPALARYAQGYDVIRRSSAGIDPLRIRPLTYALLPGRDDGTKDEPPKEPREPRHPADPKSPGECSDPGAAGGKDRPRAVQIAGALKALGQLRASAFDATPAESGSGGRVAEMASRLAALEKRDGNGGDNKPATQPTFSAPARPWMLSRNAVAALPTETLDTLRRLEVDPLEHPYPVLMEKVYQHKVETEALEIPYASPVALKKIGSGYQSVEQAKYVGPPAAPMPTMPGNIHPVGIGDLLLVKQHVLRYEGGDLAHVENVLKTEHLQRDTRRLQRTETTVMVETENTKEETRDTQTTDRFSLKRETSDTIKTDTQFKAGVSVDAKYGPMVEVKANADFSTQVATESATKQAAEFSKDVVARSVSKIVERVLERRSTTTIEEFEEKYSHGFDNTNGGGHVSGFYQWIDKVMQAQVYNYGKRMLFDVALPEPATEYILMQATMADQATDIAKPMDFTLTASQINEGNYRVWARRYDVSGIEPPPPFTKVVVKAIDGTPGQDPYAYAKSDTLQIEAGYAAKHAAIAYGLDYYPGAYWYLMVGTQLCDVLNGGSSYLNLWSEQGAIGFATESRKVDIFAASIEIFCERTTAAFEAWQIKVHGAIMAGYQAKMQAYESQLAQARAAAGVVITGRNPLFNQRVITNELRKQCLTLLTAQQFDAFGALETSVQGYAQPNLARTTQQMPYVRFFEQAFEWEHIAYFFYPYFWGWKDAWKERMLLDDVDPLFADFLRAGAARVVFPVRPGFEAAVIHYIETGEIWNGGPPPDITSPLYVPIIKEIEEATGAPGSEIPVGDPWEVRLPTTLVRIRPNDDMPTWAKQNEVWVAQN